VRRVGDRHNLVEGFLGPDHAQIGAGAFFGRLGALLEVNDFRVEGVIALTKLRILPALFSDSGAKITRFAETFGGEPQLTLQSQRDYTQNDEHPA